MRTRGTGLPSGALSFPPGWLTGSRAPTRCGGLLLHPAGGARSHRSHYRQHGAHPNEYYTYGRGW
jgi:hypothetical protein